MYENVFQFSSRPFTTAPFVKHYFAAEAIHDSLGQARLCIDRASGPVVVVGSVGTGKSLLLAMLEEQYQSQFKVVTLGCSRLGSRQEFLQTFLFQLSLPFKGMSESEARLALIDFLKPGEQCPNGVLLLIDEAHTLGADLLDEIRLVTNFVRDGQPRVRLVMAGTNRLEDNLTDPKLESFNQRIAARCYLEKLNRDETSRYVIEHIDRVGGQGEQLFNPESLKTIHEVSDGCPRLINQVCDHSLILAGTRNESVITENLVREAWADVQSIPGGWAPPAVQPETPAVLEGDESWTVIEFGQLEESTDEQASSEGLGAATVFDFSNSDGSPSTVEQESEAVDQRTNLQEESEPEITRAGDEPEERIVGWEETEEQTDSEVRETELESSEPAEEGPSQAELERVAEEKAERELEFRSVFGLPNNETQDTEATGESNDYQHDEPETNEASSTIEQLQAEQESLLDQVQSETGLGVAAGTLGLGAALAGMASAGQDDAESQLHREPEMQVEAETGMENAAESVEQPTEQKPVAEDVPQRTVAQTFVMESPDELPTPAAEEETATPEQATPVQEADDPFAEAFAEEELLKERFAPFVAHQNQSSLSVTSNDLENIVPVDEGTWEEAADVAQEHVESTVAFDQRDESSPESQAQAPAQPQRWGDENVYDEPRQPASTPENFSVAKNDEPLGIDVPAAPNVFVVGEQPTESELEASAQDRDPEYVNPFTAESTQRPVVATVEIASPQQHSVDENIAQSGLVHQMTGQSTTEPGYDSSAGSSQGTVEQIGDAAEAKATEQFHQHVSEVDSSDIQRQAEEILKRLSVSESVSHETSQGQNDREANPPVAPLQRSVPMTMPMVDVDASLLGNAADQSTANAQDSADGSEFEKQKSALDESQKILNEILAQKSMLAGQQPPQPEPPQPEPPQPPSRETPATMQIEYPMEPSTNQAEGQSPDDREMLIISRMEQEAESKKKPEEPIAFPNTPISTGRAERMDYQKLFDQLRDISNNE